MEKLYSDSFLRDLDRPALQALCKKHGLKAMGKREALVRLLSRQPAPGHEIIKKDMSKRKAPVPANPEKKPDTASRRSPRNAACVLSSLLCSALDPSPPAALSPDTTFIQHYLGRPPARVNTAPGDNAKGYVYPFSVVARGGCR
ncbi:hypothetical protein AURDEDRAFT_177232 [Auricularia subglabra TFB-10046 SS5]|uniref:SAP domain-containing protein n=1 Tax=Auricularia subglabra (strain TFB-10046 / SS5) TaxID=717982 RepID=J0CTN0_AURST|nr:hypothetical protein AURDEDRAFT_177232 [Auricularia subglabra TFB-10046 SS5]